jgi:hypothetical protein
MTLVPALGRDYKSRAEVLADFNANKDFVLEDPRSRWDGKYINREQLIGQTVTIRYANLRKSISVRVDTVEPPLPPPPISRVRLKLAFPDID